MLAPEGALNETRTHTLKLGAPSSERGRRLGFVSAGGTMGFASLDLSATSNTAAPELTKKSFGPMGSVGLDLMLSPELSLRASFLGRFPLTKATWEPKESEPTPDESGEAEPAAPGSSLAAAAFAARNDRLMTLQGTLGLTYGF